ncbi:hypothetical protein COCMIDRAFT_46078, partial [Bipolaris oryzae ATCC 44560]
MRPRSSAARHFGLLPHDPFSALSFRLDHLRLVHSILCKFAPHRLLVASLGIPWMVCINTFPQLRVYVEVCTLVFHPEKALDLVQTLCLSNNPIVNLLDPRVPGYLHGLGHV